MISQRRHYLIAGILAFGAITYVYPLLYMLGRSFCANDFILQGQGPLLTLEHYSRVFAGVGFLQYLANSLFVLIPVLLGNVLFSLMVGYAFARYRFPGKNVLFGLVLVTLMVPKQTLMIPILEVMVRLGLHNTLLALILPFCADSFNIFLIRQYISHLPEDLEDAARIDGASEFRILREIIGPLCRPVLAVMVINTTIVTWNSFLFPLILTDSADMRTLPVGLAMYTQGPYSTDWGALMAGATVSSLPLILVFLAFQSQIIEGITAGATRD